MTVQTASPVRFHWVRAVALVSGLVSAAANCCFVLRALSASRLDPLSSLISELEVPGQPASAFFRLSSVLSGVAAVVLAATLSRRLPPGRLGLAGCWALALFGVAGALDASIPMDCAPSASAVCFRAEEQGPTSWPYQAHTWFDVAGTVALLGCLWLLGRHLSAHAGWRATAVGGRVGFRWMAAASALLTVMSIWYLPGVGLVQRLQVVAASVWLVVLAVDQARQPAD